MRLRARNGHIHFVYGDAVQRDQILEWKKSGNHALRDGKQPKPLKMDFSELANILLDEGVCEMDLITIPPPSFHDYAKEGGWYPSELLARELCAKMGVNLSLLWPERYQDKAAKIMQANIDKEYSLPENVKGKFVLVLDDIATTGLTLSACCDAICKAGGYPVAVAFV